MQDVNGSRFALLLGQPDWGGCALVPAPDAAPETTAPVALAALWADPARRSATPLEFNARTSELSLTRRVARFRAGLADQPPDLQRRLGAAADGNANVYWVADGGQRIDVLSAGSRQVSVFWSMQATPFERAPAGDFAPPVQATPPAPRTLRGLAVTSAHYLVAGLLPQEELRGGLLVFDLLAGGPPLQISWPTDWPFVPHDFAARPCGGLAVLDRLHARVWMLDRRLGMHAIFAVDAGEAPQPGDFASPAAAAPAAPPLPRRPWFDLVQDAAGGTDPVAIEVLADDALLVLDGAGSDGFALVSIYQQGALGGRASTRVALDVIDADDVAGFVLRGFDCALQVVAPDAPARLVVASHEGNQCIAFDLWRGSPGLVLDPVESFLPMRRFTGQGLVCVGAPSVPGDTGLLYDSVGSWAALVEQRRPRFAAMATLLTPVLDGREPACVWHRLLLDGCIPAGCLVRVETRAADQPDELAQLAFQAEPRLLLRPDGAELPWLLDGPAAATEPARGIGCWELLFQRAHGQFMQLRLTLSGDELSTPRLLSLRAWYPRFSYSRRYLPAVYQEDAASADFLERFLANFEGMLTCLEDRIAAASALFDVRSAPAETLDWLAGWLGLVLDPAMDPARRRQLIEFAIPLYQYRGTTQGVRLAVQLALSSCVPKQDFALPAASQRQPYGVRIVEHYLTRSVPRALLGETVLEAPRLVNTGQRWSVADGAEGLQRRYRARLVHSGVANAESAVFGPLPPDTRADLWRDFCAAELGAVPQLASALQQAWTLFRQSGRAAGLGALLPGNWPSASTPQGLAQQDAWRAFISTALAPGLRRWLARWQQFMARRHLRRADYQRASGLDWPQFDLIPAPTVLPDSASALADWVLFETRLEPMALAAHRFSVLLPSSGPLADAGALAQDIELATRVVRLAKPAHTSFDVRQYWALFRIGQARLGLDSLLGQGSRAPELAPPIVVGSGHLGAGRLAPRPSLPADRVLLQC
jgi:phage tail-like protein